MSASGRSRRVASGVAALVFIAPALLSCGGSGSNTTSADPPMEQLKQRRAAGASLHRPDEFTGFLPNHRYVFDDGLTLTYSTDVVRGTVGSVRRGRAFADATEDETVPGDGSVVSFDDPNAMWATFHVEVRIDEVIESSSDDLRRGATITVGLAMDPRTTEEQIHGSLSAESYVVLLNRTSGVFGYDPDVFATAEDGTLLVSVDDQGRLALPARSDADDLLEDVKTIDDLIAAADHPVEEEKVAA